MCTVLSVSLPEPLAAERSRLATERDRFKSNIIKESVSPYPREAWFRAVRRHLLRRAKRPGVRAEADLFRAVS
jgi:predicted transcriptional regulator